MKQVLQVARTGEIQVADVPVPRVLPGCVLVRVAASLVSAGTERASYEFARKSLLQKARARPDLVHEVVSKIRRDGVLSAVAAARGRLDQPNAPGYSSAGTVVEVGEGVHDLSTGDHVACSGTGSAVHAELACVPRLLVAKVPAESAVTPEEAAFSTVGAVAMHGIRTAEVKLGDVVAVIGLGLLGQLTVQLLKAAGCRTLGMDIVAERMELALRMGADAVCASGDELHELCLQHSADHGADAVLITAETPSSAPVNLAGRIARDRGIVVAVGTVGMDIERKTFYEKELDFRISRSYGPGRYDSAYEQKGRDYPIGYVRWTETRNMEAFIQLLAAGKLGVQALITHRFTVERAEAAYRLIISKKHESFLGVLITYPGPPQLSREIQLVRNKPILRREGASVAVGVLGTGAFALTTLLPAIKKTRAVTRVGICAASGSHAHHAASKFGFHYCATDENRIFNDTDINAVVIATRHHLHVGQVLTGLAAGKHVFCEKPLCLTTTELAEIVHAYAQQSAYSPVLMVGFNRRFAPMAIRMKAFLQGVREPLAMHYRVNAGYLPPDHWINDPEQGGGRILGEACHFVDFLTFLAGAPPIEVHTHGVASFHRDGGDNAIISLRFANRSQGTISYLASGDRSYSKERVEVFGGGAVAVLEDYRSLELVRHGRKQAFKARFRRDKGHRAEFEAFATAIRHGGESPIPFDEIVTSTLATLAAAESRGSGQPVAVDAATFIATHSTPHLAVV